MKRGIYKKTSELSAWDLDKNCRNFINQHSEKNRKLKKKIRKSDRKRLDKYFDQCYNETVERSDSDEEDLV